MAVQDPSSDYLLNIDRVTRCRDCILGEEELKRGSNARKYLPGFSGSSNDKDIKDAYLGYLFRAAYFNTVARTKGFLKGLVTRIPAIPKVPDSMKPFMKNVTGDGVNFYNFSTHVLDEVLSTGWGAILVEYDNIKEDIITQKDAKKSGYRSKMKWYPMESIFNTETSIRLYTVEITEVDEFTVVEKEIILVLDIDDEGFYRRRKYQLDENKSKKKNKKSNKVWIQFGKTVYPIMNGKKMTFIPFFPCGAEANSMEVEKPPLVDLADVSLHHYGVYADYRNGIHFTGFPQLYIAGHKDDKTKLVMGSGVAWEFEDSTASVKYAEFTGSGLEHPEKLLDRLENYMGKLGARMLMVEKRAAESADKVRQDTSSESSLLAGIANNVSSALSQALNVVKEWSDYSGDEITVELNTDYDSVKIDPALLIAMMKGIQGGFITLETFVHNMKKGEILSPDRSIEEEIKELLKIRKEMEKKMKKADEDVEDDPLSERNKSDLKNPSEELRDNIRKKTNFKLKT
jgi:hypothetical protein